MADEPLHFTLALGIGGHIVMLDVHAGLLALHGVLLLGHNALCRKQQRQKYYELTDFHFDDKRQN